MSKLEVAERVAVIGGALLGALAFSWQIADSWANQKETLAFSTGWRHAGDSATHFSVEIINKSSRPVFLRDADIDIPMGWLGPGIREVERVSLNLDAESMTEIPPGGMARMNGVAAGALPLSCKDSSSIRVRTTRGAYHHPLFGCR